MSPRAAYRSSRAWPPLTGPTTGGITVVINGTNFLGVTGAAGEKFGANNATSYTVDSDTRITAVLPAGNGLVNVTVTNSASTSSTVGTADDFQYTTAGSFVLSG